MEEKNQPPSLPPHAGSVAILKLAVISLVGFGLVMFVFAVGIWVGEKRAEFSFLWAENYHRNFGGPQIGMMQNFPEQDFTNAHGVYGSVIAINGNTIIVAGQDNIEKNVVISKKTSIVDNVGSALTTDISLGDMILVIGDPDDQGQVQARFIRIFPGVSATFFIKIYQTEYFPNAI